jgi:NAD-dependent SIR2 family protein deacetylase
MAPTICHHFIGEFAKRSILGINLSQNIDGLEFTAGVPENKLV